HCSSQRCWISQQRCRSSSRRMQCWERMSQLMRHSAHLTTWPLSHLQQPMQCSAAAANSAGYCSSRAGGAAGGCSLERMSQLMRHSAHLTTWLLSHLQQPMQVQRCSSQLWTTSQQQCRRSSRGSLSLRRMSQQMRHLVPLTSWPLSRQRQQMPQQRMMSRRQFCRRTSVQMQHLVPLTTWPLSRQQQQMQSWVAAIVKLFADWQRSLSK
ncbi:hypothetical protein COO60DRAFT_1556764, partial [Scenedesmus sp. NREL 46B-D3]